MCSPVSVAVSVISPTDWSGAVEYKLLALLGGFLGGAATVVIKKLRETDSSYAIFLSQCLFGLAMICWPAARNVQPVAARAWLMLFGVGVSATLGQLLMTYSFKLLSATQGSLLAFVTPVCNVFMGFVMFGEELTPRSAVGSVLVIAACASVSITGSRSSSG